MKKIQKHIEIVRSTSPGLSSLGSISSQAIFDVLSRHFAFVGQTIVNTEHDLELLVAKQPDIVFLGMKRLPLRSTTNKTGAIWVAEYLEQNGITYTGSSWRAIELERNKSLAKQRVHQAGLNTPLSFVIKNNKQGTRNMPLLQFPLFVKPVSMGGSSGIGADSVVHNKTTLDAKTASLSAEFMADILVEEYLPGREFSVSVLRDQNTGGLVAMPVELVPPLNINGQRIRGKTEKYSGDEIVLPVHDSSVSSKVNTLALGVFKAIGARDYGRIDVRLDIDGQPHFLEANLIPSLVDGDNSFQAAYTISTGNSYEQMILNIVNLAIGRSFLTDELELELPKGVIFSPA